MAQAPLRLTRSLLASHRPGALVCVAIGAAASIPRRRPRGFQLRAVEQVAPAGHRGALPPAPPAVAVVQVRGVLEQRSSWYSCGETDGYDAIEERFVAALSNPEVGSLVLDVDSPGGDVPGLEQTTARMLAAKSRFGKPVVGYVNELAASAALRLMVCVCDSIQLPPSGIMGSVGTAIVHANESRALDAEGIDVAIVRDPAGKMNPNSSEALDELGRARLQAMVSEGTARFVADVAAARGIDAAVIRAWNGATFMGAAAVAQGLADGVGSLDDSIALAASLAALNEGR